MRNLLCKLLSAAVLTIGVLFLIASPAQAQGQCQCEPFSGTFYGGATDTWHAVADITIGNKVYHATILVVNTSSVDDGDILYATETWTLDFGRGNTIQLMTHAVAEHMTDAVAESGVFHVIELGTFANGTGVFKHAYGSLISTGPFGPGVTLPPDITLPPEAAGASWFWVGPSQGMICGMKDRDEKRD
jgi:hypothetical protein